MMTNPSSTTVVRFLRMQQVRVLLLLLAAVGGAHAFLRPVGPVAVTTAAADRCYRHRGAIHSPPSAFLLSATGPTDDDGGGLAKAPSDASSSSSLADKISGFDPARVLENLRSGTLGTRGEIYVAAQFGLIAAVLVGWPPLASSFLGPVLTLVGLAVIAASVLDLGADSLTPFLPPTDAGSLKTTGIYAFVRHPLYAGLVAAMAGISLTTDSVDRLVGTAALLALVDAKADLEEGYLEESYPNDYPEYKKQVPGRFLPGGLSSLGRKPPPERE